MRWRSVTWRSFPTFRAPRRDVIEVRLDLGGYPVILADTAGLREAGDAIEREGVRRAEARARAADLRSSCSTRRRRQPQLGLDPEVIDGAEIVVWNKRDVAEQARQELSISATTGEGIGRWWPALADCGQGSPRRRQPCPDPPRHRHALEQAQRGHRGGARRAGRTHPSCRRRTSAWRLTEIGRITGRVDLDDLLDVGVPRLLHRQVSRQRGHAAKPFVSRETGRLATGLGGP